jgi:hypothetical protein
MQLGWGGAETWREKLYTRADYIVTCQWNYFDLIRIQVYAASNCASFCTVGCQYR